MKCGILTSLFTRILDVWCATGNPGKRLIIYFFAILVSICACCALVGAVPTFIYGTDNFFLLENGWRALHGLRPHLDFWSPWGPLTFLLVALGLKLSHNTPNAIAYGTAIFAALVGLWTYRIGRHRLAPAPRALLGVYAAALACAPYPLGSEPMFLSTAMIYNRYGYALLVIVLLECFQRVDTPSPNPEELMGGLSTGAALALALFLKASYFVTGLGLVAASLVLWFPSVRRFLGMLVGFSAVAFCGLAYLRFDVGSMLRALHMAAIARTQALSLATPIHKIHVNLTLLLCVVVLAMAASFLKRRRPEWLGELFLPISAVIVSVADIAIMSTNMQSLGLPLLAAFALLIASRISDSAKPMSVAANQVFLPYYASVLLLAGLVFLPQFARDVLALPFAAIRKIHPPAVCAVRFTEPRVAGLLLCDGGDYTTYVNDGIVLLKQYGNSTDKVLTMDAQNPFPYVLGWLPPRGGMAATDFNYTFSAQARPSFDEYFGDATLVMVPKHSASDSFFDPFFEIYGPEMQNRFRLVAESDWFRLYKRK